MDNKVDDLMRCRLNEQLDEDNVKMIELLDDDYTYNEILEIDRLLKQEGF